MSRGARQAAARSARDVVPGRSARHRRREARAAGRPAAERARCREGFAAWREHNVVPQEPAWLRDGRHHAAARRLDVRAARALADAGSATATGDAMRTTVEQNDSAAALGERGGPARRLRGAREDRPGDGRRFDDQRHHGLPGHGTLQARHLACRARSRPRACEAHPQVGHRQGPERQGPAHQGQRLLQHFVRAATTSPTWFPGRVAQRGARRRAGPAACRGRPVDEQRRLVRPRHRRRAERRVPEIVGSKLPRSASPAERQGNGDLRRLRDPHRQEDHPRCGRGACNIADLRPGPDLLQRLGRPARVHDPGHGRRGRARARWCPTSEVELASAERELFESQILMDEKKLDAANARAFSSMLIAARALRRRRERANVSGPGRRRGRRRVPGSLYDYDTEVFLRSVRGRPLRGKYFSEPATAEGDAAPSPRRPSRRTSSSRRRRSSSTPRTSAIRASAPS